MGFLGIVGFTGVSGELTSRVWGLGLPTPGFDSHTRTRQERLPSSVSAGQTQCAPF